MPGALLDLLARAAPLAALADFSDALDPATRIAELRLLGARDLAALWRLAEGAGTPIGPELLVPDSTPAGHGVDWQGKNSLPAFSHFSKRFTRAPEPGALTGHNTGAMQWLVGPGYFTAVARPGRPGELLFDYTRYPAEAPRGWPALRRNESGVARLVFAGMHDYFRPVGRHLGIGAAFDQGGRFKGQYFALARGETFGPPPV